MVLSWASMIQRSSPILTAWDGAVSARSSIFGLPWAKTRCSVLESRSCPARAAARGRRELRLGQQVVESKMVLPRSEASRIKSLKKLHRNGIESTEGLIQDEQVRLCCSAAASCTFCCIPLDSSRHRDRSTPKVHLLEPVEGSFSRLCGG